MKLRDLLLQSEIESASKDIAWEGEVTSLTADSREIASGSLFVAIRGGKVDGRTFIEEAFRKGATAVLYDGETLSYELQNLIRVQDARGVLSHLADRFYRHPSHELATVAVTGTSGKTSVCWIFAQVAARIAMPTFYGGTLGFKIFDGSPRDREEMKELSNTTMDPLSNQRALRAAVDEGAKAAILEATSQGLVQQRTRDIAWDGAVFTNLSRDHLDLHGSMEGYEAAKRILFFDELQKSPKKNRFAVFNIDDAAGMRIALDLKRAHPEIRVVSFGVSNFPEAKREGVEHFQLENLTADVRSVHFTLRSERNELSLHTPLIGAHNASNVACAALALFLLGHSPQSIAANIQEIPAVPGRLEPVLGGIPAVYVDYAHKPDGLEKVQQFLKPLTKGRLITVFGCGGDRDRGKRPLMGKIVQELADVGIVTSDNPRTEDPQAIVDEILQGMPGREGFLRIVQVDRRKAIEEAIALAKPGDIVLIAGKGHEPYQEVNGVKHHFSDSEEARRVMGLL